MRVDGSGYSPYVPTDERQSTLSAKASVTSSGSSDAMDWSNITTSQMIDGMNALIKNGKMTFDQSSGMVGLAMTPLTQAYGGATPVSGTYNVLAELQTGIAGSKSRGDTTFADRQTDVLGILESTSRKQGVNTIA